MKERLFSRVIFVSLISAMILILSVQTGSSILANNVSNQPNNFGNKTIDGNVVTSNMIELGQWDESFGIAQDSFVVDDILYVAADQGGLVVLNISDLANPVLLGQYSDPLSNVFAGIYVSGDYAFIADFYEELVVLNVSDPQNILYINSYDTGEYISCFKIINNLAFIGAADNLIVLNVTNPMNIVHLGTYTGTTAHVHYLNVFGNYAYLANYHGGLEILNVTDVTSITQASALTTGVPFTTFVKQGNFIIAGMAYSDIEIIDVSDPTNPTQTTTIIGSGGTSALAKSGNYLYFYDWYSISVYDVTTPTSPSFVRTLTVNEHSTRFYRKNNVLISMSHYFGLEIFDITAASDPAFAGSYSFGGKAMDVAVKGNYAYVANMDAGLSVIDISNSANPYEVYNYKSYDVAPREITIEGNYAYVSDQKFGFSVYNITNPIRPVLVYKDAIMGIGLGVKIYGDYAFACCNQDGLRIYDISDKEFIHLVGARTDNGFTEGVYVKGQYAYCADSNDGLEIIDISDVTNPVEVNEIGDRCYDADGVWKYLLTLESSGYSVMLRIYDLTNPTSISLLTTVPIDSPVKQLDVHGDWAFLSTQYGFEVINWYNYLTPSKVGGYYDGGQAEGADIVNGTYYVADRLDGLEILTLAMSDFDDDRLPDNIETGIYDTDPLVRDSDGDGLFDGEETDLTYTLPLIVDTDADSYSDYVEWFAGTDPRDPTSAPTPTVATGFSYNVLILSVSLVLFGLKIVKEKRRRRK